MWKLQTSATDMRKLQTPATGEEKFYLTYVAGNWGLSDKKPILVKNFV